jgi:hypothetical protein
VSYCDFLPLLVLNGVAKPAKAKKEIDKLLSIIFDHKEDSDWNCDISLCWSNNFKKTINYFHK